MEKWGRRNEECEIGKLKWERRNGNIEWRNGKQRRNDELTWETEIGNEEMGNKEQNGERRNGINEMGIIQMGKPKGWKDGL
ncbi:hypothetical protein TNCV_5087781 [Trichonephila clavipes]|nr:hypothetical protein TNCV_5087781 [Trichonephila clavipes]